MALRPDLIDALRRAAHEINTPPELESTLQAIAHTAVTSLPGVEFASVSTLHADGTVTTGSATHPLALELDQLQYELNEGPCLHAIKAAGVTSTGSLRDDARWPRYAPRATERGITAQMGLRLTVADETFGSLNLYSTDRAWPDADTAQTAELLAGHAAVALRRATLQEHLTGALSTRKHIGQAIGILMERYQLDEDRAFQYLARVSQHSNIKLRDVAAELVEQSNTKAHLSG